MTWPVILFICLFIALVGAAPFWPYSRSWGPFPSVVLLIATILVGFKVFGVI